MSLVTLVENAGRKFEAGDFSEAVALYKDALELKPNCLEALLGLGITYQSMVPPLLEAANVVARKALEIDERSAPARFLIAVGKQRRGDIDASLSSYTELISAYKEGSMKDADVYAAACTNTGLILEGKGRHADSIKQFRFDREAISACPDHADALAFLGAALFKQPDVRPAEAMGYLDRALAVNPTLFTALLSKACALESLGKQTEAIEAFKDAAEVSSDEAKASIQFRLGQLLFITGQYSAAIASFDMGLTCCKPSEAKLYHLHLGMCYEASKNTKKAIVAYRKATELDALYRDAAWRLALAIQKESDSAALVSALTALVDAHPDNTQHRVALGNALLDLGETSKAVDVLAGACERSPDNYQAMFSFAVALHLIGDLEEAKVRYDRAIRLSPAPLVRAHYNLSLLYAGSGSSSEAAREAKKAMELSKAGGLFAQAGSVLIIQLLRDGVDNAVVLPLCQKVLEADPRQPKALMAYALAQATGRPDLGVNAAQKAVSIVTKASLGQKNMEVACAYAVLGAALHATGDVGAALREYSTALDTLDFLQLVAMNKLIESKRKPDAVIPRARQSSIVSVMDEAARIRAPPTEGEEQQHLRTVVLCNMGTCHWIMNSLDDADAVFRKVLEADPENVTARKSLAEVSSMVQQKRKKTDDYVSALALHSSGQFEEACEKYSAAIASDPRDHLCHYGLGVCLSGSGKIDEAIESLQSAVKLKPNDVLSLSALAAALHASGTSERLLRAKAMYLRVLELDSMSSFAHSNLGLLLLQEKNFNDAIVRLREALRLNPDVTRGSFLLGCALFGKNQLRAACTAFEDAVAKDPKDWEAYIMLGTTQDKLNERGQAIAAYMRVCLAAGATPGFSVDANVSAGQLAQETNKLDTAKRAYEEALLAFPGCIEALVGLGAVYEARREFDSAEDYYFQAQTINPSDPDITARLTQIRALRSRH